MTTFEFGILPEKKGIKQVTLKEQNISPGVNINDGVYLDSSDQKWHTIKNRYTPIQGFFIGDQTVLIKGIITYGSNLQVGKILIQEDDLLFITAKSNYFKNRKSFVYCGTVISPTEVLIDLQWINGTSLGKAGYLPSDVNNYDTTVQKFNYSTEIISTLTDTLSRLRSRPMGFNSDSLGYIVAGGEKDSSGNMTNGSSLVEAISFSNDSVSNVVATISAKPWIGTVAWNESAAYIIFSRMVIGDGALNENHIDKLHFGTIKSTLISRLSILNSTSNHSDEYEYGSSLNSPITGFISLYKNSDEAAINTITKLDFIIDTLYMLTDSLVGAARIFSAPASYLYYGYYIGGTAPSNTAVRYSDVDKLDYTTATLIKTKSTLENSWDIGMAASLTTYVNTYLCGGAGNLHTSNANKVTKFDNTITTSAQLSITLSGPSYFTPHQAISNK